jgi:hypothetical protein
MSEALVTRTVRNHKKNKRGRATLDATCNRKANAAHKARRAARRDYDEHDDPTLYLSR